MSFLFQSISWDLSDVSIYEKKMERSSRIKTKSSCLHLLDKSISIVQKLCICKKPLKSQPDEFLISKYFMGSLRR